FFKRYNFVLTAYRIVGRRRDIKRHKRFARINITPPMQITSRGPLGLWRRERKPSRANSAPRWRSMPRWRRVGARSHRADEGRRARSSSTDAGRRPGSHQADLATRGARIAQGPEDRQIGIGVGLAFLV